MRRRTMHGNQHIPRGISLTCTPLVNEYGSAYGYTWYPAGPDAAEDTIFVLADAPADCQCDACRGLSSVWDQHRWGGAR